MTQPLFADLAEAAVPPPAKRKATRKPAAPSGPAYGPVSAPGHAPGLPGSATTPVDQQPLPAFGVEVTGADRHARKAANDRAAQIARGIDTSDRPGLKAALKALTDDERQALHAYSGGGNLGESTDAYYTPTRLAYAVWYLLTKLDPRIRTALEPSCGAGPFLATAPAGVRLTGVEYDPDAARVAQVLHPHAHIHHGPFETYHATSADPRPDVIIGNPPFGSRGETIRLDPRHDHLRRAERYFLTAGLDRLAPGGYLAFVLPQHLMGERHQTFRQDLMNQAAVIGAYLIPAGAFTATGASVTTMLLVLRRHDHGVPEVLRHLPPHLRDTLYSTKDRAFMAGTACIENGHVKRPSFSKEHTVTTGQYGLPHVAGAMELSDTRISTIVSDAQAARDHAVTAATIESLVLTANLGDLGQDLLAHLTRAERHPIPEGALSDCRSYVFRRGQWRYASLLATPEAQTVMDLARELQREQLTARPSATKAHLTRTLHAQAASVSGRDPTPDDLDAQAARIRTIARTYPAANLVLHPPAVPEQRPLLILPGSLQDVAVQLARGWDLTVRTLSRHAQVTEAQAGDFLLEHYRFDGYRWVPPIEYDFGHAYEKAREARRLAAAHPHGSAERRALTQQADTLEDRALAQAKSITDTAITPRDPLVPVGALQAWVNAYLGTSDGDAHRLLITRDRGLTRIVVRHGTSSDRYHVDESVTGRLERYLNFDTEVDRIERADMSAEQIEAQKAAALKKAVRYERSIELHFRTWLQSSEYASETEDAYNRTRNAYLTGPEDTSLLHLPEWKGPPHHLYQRGDIRTLAAWGHGLLGYDVGLGKTFALLGLLSVLKQRGEAQRPWIVTPLSLTGNWVMNAHVARPDWRVVVIGMNPTGTFDEDGLPEFTPDTTPQRKEKLARLLHEPHDLVIISMEAFTDIPLLEETRIGLIERDAAQLAQGAEHEGFDVKQSTFRGRKALVKEEDFLSELISRGKTATATDLPFELFAPDCLAFEEAHKFKNLFEAPDYLGDKPKFMGAGRASIRAYDAYLKARWVREQQRGRGTYSLTGTPWKNSPLEVGFSMALVTDDLTAFGLNTPASFMLQYCQIEPTVITRSDGGVGSRPAVVGFKNLRELRSLMNAHVITRDALSCQMDTRVGLPIPPLQRHIHTLELTREQEAAYIPERLAAQNPQREGDNHLFAIYNRMQGYIIHPEGTCGGRNPRAEKMAEIALDAETTGHKSVIFLDRGGDGGPDSAYAAYKGALVQAGIPEDAIEIITATTHPNAVVRLAAEKRFRQGKTRHVIGSSVIREGFNLQHLTKHLIHLDLPHDPQDIKQRDGRGWRQGNPSSEIHSHFLLARGSHDALAFTNIQGKKGWLDHLASDSDSGENPVAFQAAQTALLLAADPDKVAEYLKEREEAMRREAQRLAEREQYGLAERFLSTAALLRDRHTKAQGRKHGPSKQDVQGVTRLTGELTVLARELARQPEAVRRLLHLDRVLTWVDGLPLTCDLGFTLDGKAYTVKHVDAGGHVTTTCGARLTFDVLEAASGVTLPDGDTLYTANPLRDLPVATADTLHALLTEPQPEESAAPVDPAAPDPAEPAAHRVRLHDGLAAHEALLGSPTLPDPEPRHYAGDRAVRIGTAATLPHLYQPVSGGLRRIPADTRPGEGVMLVGISDDTVELIAAPATAAQLGEMLDVNPGPILDRIAQLLTLYAAA